jgi:phage/plasmid-associated DNA primase
VDHPVRLLDVGDRHVSDARGAIAAKVEVTRFAALKSLADRLLAERDGILGWAVAGCLEWQRLGLSPPSSVLAATDEYFEAEDAVGRWLNDASEIAPEFCETTTRLFGGWRTWAVAKTLNAK